ncbi:hypothetical protein [Bradyrhizobium sp.]|uniref:hypothetical protein n=1 Tax=Bradyrhizobium sp. TaxID=376 RepID=UPI003C78BE96
MSLFVLDAIFWIFGIRGHIPSNDDFHGGPNKSSVTADSGRLLRVLAVFVVIAVLLSLAVWAAVWLAIKSL